MKKSREPEIIKLSASSVKTYTQCPKKYYFNYIERAKKKHWDHFDLGNICHKALEFFHEVYMKEGLSKHKSFNNLMKRAFEEAQKDFPKATKDILLEAKDLLKGYLDMTKKSGVPTVQGVEESFEISIGNGVILRGFVDRLDIMDDGTYRIVDYKTTKNVKYLDEKQLLIYGIWLQEKHKNVDFFKGSYLLLRHKCKYKEYAFNMEDVEKMKKELLEYADKIQTENVWEPITGVLCRYCDFLELCSAAQEELTW